MSTRRVTPTHDSRESPAGIRAFRDSRESLKNNMAWRAARAEPPTPGSQRRPPECSTPRDQQSSSTERTQLRRELPGAYTPTRVPLLNTA